MTTTILPSRKPYGAPYYSPSSRPIYYGGPSAGTYPLSFAALGMTGAGGIVFDSIESAILQSTGGAVAGNGDVIGDVTDVSGNGIVIAQATGANKPTNTVTNGIGAITLGNSKFLAATLGASITVPTFSAVYVIYNPAVAGTFYPFVMNTESLDYVVVENNQHQYRVDNAQLAALNDAGGVARIVHLRHHTAAAGGQSLKVYDMAGALVGSATGNSPSPDVFGTAFNIGYNNTQKAGEVAFMLATSADINDTLFGTIKTELVSRFGGWK